MKIDCKNLPCPQPVLETKKALEDLEDDGILEVFINSVASKENVKRFAEKEGWSVTSLDLNNGETKLTIVKGFSCEVVKKEVGTTIDKDGTLFITSDKIGEGELGEMLMSGFFKAMAEGGIIPKEVIFVNKGVKIPTMSNDKELIRSLKTLEKSGTKILSCGTCLQYYKLEEFLKVGKISDALTAVTALIKSNNSITL